MSSSRSPRDTGSIPPKICIVSPAGTTRAQYSSPTFTCRLPARSRTSWTSPVRTSRSIICSPRRTPSTSCTERCTSSHCAASNRSSAGSSEPRTARKSANAPPSNSTASAARPSSMARSNASGESQYRARLRGLDEQRAGLAIDQVRPRLLIQPRGPRVSLGDLTAKVPGATAGFRPGDRVPGVPPIALCPTNLNSALRLRRSGTDETSLATNLVTDLVTGHTCKRPSPNRKGPLTCDDVGSGGRI